MAFGVAPRPARLGAGCKLFLALLLLLSAAGLAQDGPNTAGGPAWELRICAPDDSLPYSNRQEQGFTNKIADILADELHARLSYLWLPRLHSPGLEGLLLRTGECDLFLGVLDGQEPFLTTIAYYQSTSVFVTRPDGPEVESLDDPQLKTLRLGVSRGSPPDYALVKRGIIENVRHFQANDLPSAPLAAVAKGELDVAIVWGPLAGFYAKQQSVPLELTPVTPQVDLPLLPMVQSISMGIRMTDEDFRDLLNRAIASRWDDIQAILEDYGVPLLPLPKPRLTTEGR